MQAGMLHAHSAKLTLVHKGVDCVMILLALYLASIFYPVTLDYHYGYAALFAVLLYPIFADSQHVYGSWRAFQPWQEMRNVGVACLITVLVLVVLAFLSKTSSLYSRVVISSWAAGSLLLLIGYRLLLRTALRYARRQGMNSRSMVIAGSGPVAQRLAMSALQSRWLGLNVLGFYDDQRPIGYAPLAQHPELQVLGSLADMVSEVKQGGVDQVYVALPMSHVTAIESCVNGLADATASVYVVPDLFVFELMHARWYRMDDLPVVSVYETPFQGVDGWLKRAEDVVLATLILLVVAVPMLLIAAAVKLSSPGPVLFRQRRYGLNGQVVEVWKFRSMRVCEDGDVIRQATAQDARVTPLGALLRCTSLDELPQFINVLQGTMSVVGPRPHAVAHNEQYRSLVFGYMLRHKVKPGITGLAQVKGWRGETDTLDKMQQRVECDLKYIRNWTLWLDIKIVVLTIIKGFTGKNVY